MTKRITSLFLVLALCMALFPVTALAADVPTGVEGAGTEENPYLIGTADQLYAFADWYNTNAGTLLNDESNTYVKLTADINLNAGFTFTSGGYKGEGRPKNWVPIGTLGTNFSPMLPYLGEFDGAGHTISGLYLSEDSTTTLVAGLFGYFAGYLHDVKIENSYISSKSACTGAFAGIMGGTIENCHADAHIYSDAQTGGLNGTGGIVGNLNDVSSEVLNCTFAGSVSSDNHPYTGGIVGDNVYGYVADCINNGTVTSSQDKVGGIIGNNQVAQTSDEPVSGKSSIIERCVNNGSISGRNSSGGDYVGGIVGMSSWSFDKSYTGAIRDCLNSGTISGSVAGGIVGNLETATKVENCLNIGTISGTLVGGIAGSHIKSCSIQNSYYKETEGLTAVGRLGSSDGDSIPTDAEKISGEEAKATTDQISSGEI